MNALTGAQTPSNRTITPGLDQDSRLNDHLRDSTPERERLDRALLQDFLDTLPDPISIRELAAVLRTPRTAVTTRVRRGQLVGRKTAVGWSLPIDANRDWIRARWKAGSVAPRPLGRRDVREPVYVMIDDADALRALHQLANGPEDFETIVNAALRVAAEIGSTRSNS